MKEVGRNEAQMMSGIALTLMVKTVLETPGGRVRLTEADFGLSDSLSPNDKWTIEVDDDTGDVWIGLLREEQIS